jgi:hypothetical protein
MKFIGNYAEIIQPSWIEELLSKDGLFRPRDGKKPDTAEMHNEYKLAMGAGYDSNGIYFQMFDKNNISFEVTPPCGDSPNFHWWVTKMMPGNFMPMHRDPHTMYEKNSRRFWMPLQDWAQGHIFVYEDDVITNYKAGDVYMYQDAQALHGAANIGLTPRLVLQFSTHD